MTCNERDNWLGAISLGTIVMLASDAPMIIVVMGVIAMVALIAVNVKGD